ncbi:MAG: PKD domain-containing protein [Vicinamibacteria bacterium]
MNRGLVLGLALTLSGVGSVGSAQEAASTEDLRGLQHDPPPCMDTEQFPSIEVRASTPDAARRVSRLTVHFKAEGDAGWYEVAFQPAAGTVFQAALPKPLPEAARVAYYITAARPELRSPEYLVNVLMGGCPGARAAPAELAEDIRIRRTLPTQDEIPRGFRPDGVEIDGGTSGTTLGIVAGAAGGAAIAGIALTGDEAAPTPPDPGSPEALRPCFTPDPIPDIDSGGRVRFDASCTTPTTVTSYQWNFGDGTTGQGSSVEHLFTPGGTYTVRLTVSDGQRTDSISRVLRVRATPTACFITSPDPPRIVANGSIDFNADCSVGDRDGGPTVITSYAWDFGDGDDGGEGRFVSHLFTEPDLYGVTLTVTNEDGRQDRTTQFIVVERRGSGTASEVTLTTELTLTPGTSAQLSFNDAETISTVAPSPQQHRVRARPGENVVDARLLSEATGEGRWRFDFRAEPSFIRGSIRIDFGEVLTLDAQSVVFRITGESGPPVRFRFRLQE